LLMMMMMLLLVFILWRKQPCERTHQGTVGRTFFHAQSHSHSYLHSHAHNTKTRACKRDDAQICASFLMADNKRRGDNGAEAEVAKAGERGRAGCAGKMLCEGGGGIWAGVRRARAGARRGVVGGKGTPSGRAPERGERQRLSAGSRSRISGTAAAAACEKCVRGRRRARGQGCTRCRHSCRRWARKSKAGH